mgnify:CR=1 FL=1
MDFNEACLNLNLSTGFTSSELKKQYRMMSLKYHPDKHMPDIDDVYCNKFKIIAESYQFLYKYLEERDGINCENNNSEKTDDSYNSLFVEVGGNKYELKIEKLAIHDPHLISLKS